MLADIDGRIVIARPRIMYRIFSVSFLTSAILPERLPIVQAGEFQKLLIEYF
jgi:hypothetical protein